MVKHPKGKGCWYKITHYQCPVCGCGDVVRERRWTERPLDHPYANHEAVMLYDGCMDYQLYG